MKLIGDFNDHRLGNVSHINYDKNGYIINKRYNEKP